MIFTGVRHFRHWGDPATERCYVRCLSASSRGNWPYQSGPDSHGRFSEPPLPAGSI